MLDRIIKSLSITIPSHILRSKDPRAILTALFAAWLPLSTAVLVSVIEHLPSPPVAQADRLPAMLEASPGADHVDSKLRQAMVGFETSKEDPVVAYVSKMVAIPESELPENKRPGGGILSAEEARDIARKKRAEMAKARAAADGETTDGVNGVADTLSGTRIGDDSVNGMEEQKEDPEHLIGFARLYSGTLSVGDSVYVLPPKFSPANPHANPQPRKATITALYLLMGRGLEPLISVPAGVVFGIAGLEGHILKSGTLCSQLEGGVNLAGVSMGSQPIVRVALEPVNPGDLGKMVKGLQLLEQSDPCAEYEVLESGEHVILTAGELHLERCLKDLRERFAKCEIQAGEPIVPYRESIVSAEEMAPPRDKDLPRGTVIGVTTSQQITVKLRVRPLPTSVTEFLNKNTSAIKRLYSEKKAEEEKTSLDEARETSNFDTVEDSGVIEAGALTLAEFKKELVAAFTEGPAERDIWQDCVDRVAAFGPRRVGSNMLIDATDTGTCRRV